MLVIASASWTGAKAQYWEAQGGRPAHVGDYYYLLYESEDLGTYTAILTDKQYSGTQAGSNSYLINNVIIPETIVSKDQYGNDATYTVIGIDSYAFHGSTSVKRITIPKTVVSIGKMAFEGCTNLEKITVSPENSAFYAKDDVLYNFAQTELIACAKTKAGKFTVPEDVTKIDEFAFSGCASITEIVLPNGLKEISKGAFWGCTNMASINIPTSLRVLGSDAFQYTPSLSSSITIPASVSIIGNNAFKDCSKIPSITITDGVTEIGDNAFKGCSKITSLELPASVTKLGISSFANTGITSISIPSGITNIPSSAFSGCKLTSITFSEGLQTIGANAFYNNGTTIQEVRIPESVTSIANNAFNGTTVQNFYINNIPSKIAIGENNPFKADGVTIHVFTMMKTIFQNATNWSKYASKIVDDIEITHVESIVLDKTEMAVLTNSTSKLTATINPEDARVKDVIYTSSNPNIIMIVDPAMGIFSAGDDEGEATITCTAADGTGKTAQCKVTVTRAFVPAESVTISNTELNMEVGATNTLTAYVSSPSNATYKDIVWVTSDADVATVERVSATGGKVTAKVTAKAAGYVTITAISKDGAARAKCKVTVTLGNYIVADGTEYNETEDLYVKKITYSRTYKTRNWQTLYLPFDISYNDIKDNFDVAWLNDVHQFDYDDDGTIDETKIEAIKMSAGKTIKAHTPCIIRAKVADADHTQNIVVNNAILRKAEYKSIDCSSVSTNYIFYGTYKAMTGAELVAGGYYVLTSGGFRAAKTSDIVNPYRWYFDIKDRDAESKFANTKISIICLDEGETNGEATGIETIDNDSEEIIAIYDINGRKQNEFAKGINIVKYSNGSTKKIIK